MRIIILGSTGYLGSKIAEALLKIGHEICCLKRPTSSTKNLEHIIDRIKLCNIEDLDGLLSNDTTFDCLINTSCRYPKNTELDTEIFEANLYVPLNIFLMCMNKGVKKFITIGTGLPFDFNVYTLSKHEFTEICKWYVKRRNDINEPIKICNVELENFYGEDEPKERFIPSVVEKLKRNEQILLTEGNQKRDFIYIEDVVEAINRIVCKDDLPEYLDLPIGTGEGVPVKDVVGYLKEITRSESELCFGAIEKRLYEPDSFADCTQMKKIGIQLKYNWKEGLKKII